MKHYNMFALAGDTTVTDQDVCEQLGIPAKLANTPQINDAAISKMRDDNIANYIAAGVDPEEASALANSLAQKAHQRVKESMAQEKSKD